MQRLQKQVLVTTLASLLIILLDTRFSLLDPPIPASSSNQVICTHIDQFPFAGFFPPGKLWQLPKLLFNCIIDVIGKNKFPKLPEITIFQESVFSGFSVGYQWVISGLTVGYQRVIRGLSADYQRIISGLSVGYMWVIRGLSVRYQWVIIIQK